MKKLEKYERYCTVDGSAEVHKVTEPVEELFLSGRSSPERESKETFLLQARCHGTWRWTVAKFGDWVPPSLITEVAKLIADHYGVPLNDLRDNQEALLRSHPVDLQAR